MLSFFRRLINSKVGIIVTFVVLIVIAIAFAAGDVTGLRSNATGGMSGTSVASVGKQDVALADFRQRAQTQVRQAQQQQPTLTMAGFIAQGGLDQVLDAMINGLALEQFGHQQGMVVSKPAVDRQLLAFPSLQGPTGQFDQKVYEQILRENHLTDAGVRADIARDTIQQQMIVPTIGASQVPRQLALPYASLLLEKRQGQIGFIPTKAVGAGAAPTDAELQTFYRQNIARFSLPERRAMRYAIVSPDALKAQATPSDAEIGQAYQSQRARYAPTERRTVTQVSVIDQAGAAALAAKVKGGTTIEAAARAAGLESRTLKALSKADLAGQTSAAIAAAVFGASNGATVGPVRGAIGFVVAHVDAVTQDPGKTLAQARPEIAAALTAQKTTELLGRLHDSLDDASSDNATFDEMVGDQKLQARATPAVTAAGADPLVAGSKPDPALGPIVAAGFAAEPGDPPQLVPTGADGSFAVVALGQVLPAQPRPLAQVRDAVSQQFVIDRASRAARKVASGVLGKVEHGTALADALKQTGLSLPPVKPMSADRGQIAANRDTPAPLVLLFSMAQGTAKVLEAPGKAGWLVIKLDHIQKGDASSDAKLVAGTESDIGHVLGSEYAEQFSNAVRQHVGVKKNTAALAKARAELSGGGSADQE